MEQAGQWMRQSVTLKLITIGILALILLIPASMIQSIIHERESLHQQAVYEVSNSWAHDQHISGPMLSVPLIYQHGTERMWHILPQTLDIEGEVMPKSLRRNIYEIVVYNSALHLKGKFKVPALEDTAKIQRIAWEKAFITLGISDLRGVKDQLNIRWNDQELPFQPGNKIPKIINSGISTTVPLSAGATIPFTLDLNLKGSSRLNFLPLGNTTRVNLTSKWTSPSFQGNHLPEDREVDADGFRAQWLITQLNRNYPNNWIGNTEAPNLQQSSFGVDLILPLDNYQKNIRMAKYGIMTIALTFLIFFLAEIMNGRRIHPFQYILVGLALCLFYVLLLSISEHSNFELAYVLSSLGIIIMISLYSLALMKSAKFTTWLTAALVAIYGFLFVTMQLADYALLIGSIGLFIILAATMYYTRNVNWYKVQVPKNI